jgi:putative IMPACT (imprinted ancient) family translation regulator
MKRSYDAYAGKSSQGQSLASALNKRAQLGHQAPASQDRQVAAPAATAQSPPFEGWPIYAGVSDQLHDRKSIFTGYYFPAETTAEANRLLAKFKKSRLVHGADHVMSARRVYTDGSSAGGQMTLDTFTSKARQGDSRQIITGGDDDGESYSSEKLVTLLVSSKIMGLVVCTRIYGGVLLGPVRFQHIVRVCNDAYTISNNKRILAQRAQQGNEAERAKLLRLLKARDMSIASIRTSLAARTGSQTDTSASPVKHIVSSGVDKSTETPLFTAEEPASQSSETVSPPSTPRPPSQQIVSTPTTPSSPSASKMQELYAQKPVETLKRLLAARDLTIQTLRAKLKSSPVKSPARNTDLMNDEISASQQRTQNASLFFSDND